MEEQVAGQRAEQQETAQVSTEHTSRKPMKYYIDFENVHGAGLKGVDALREDDHVLVFYSQAAETFHIEHAIDLLRSKAKIEFVEIDGGTRNSLDFQLVAALFGTISDEFGYAIVSGDGGFDAAIKMGQRLELPEVVRIVNILGDTELPAKPRARRSRSSKSAAKDQPVASEQDSAGRQEQEKPETEAQEPAKSTRRPRRRGGSRRSAAAKADQQAENPNETDVVEQAEVLADEADVQQQVTEQAEEPAVSLSAESVVADTTEATSGAETELGAQADQEQQMEKKPSDDGKSDLDNGNGNGHNGSNGNGNGGSRRRGSRGSGKSGKREDVAALLAKNGVEIDQHQLSTVMQALNGAKKRQDFYRKIIQLEKQEKGLALYREVRDYYEPMLEIVKA